MITLQRFSQELACRAPHQAPQPWGQAARRQPPESLALKVGGAWPWESLRTEGNGVGSWKEHTKPAVFRTRGQSSHWTGARARPACWSQGVSWRGGGSRAVAHPGDKDTGRGHSWELLLLGEHGLWQASAGTPQAKQLTGQGHSPTYQQTGRLKLPETTVASRRSPARHRDRTQLHPPTGGHQPNCPAVLLQALDKPHLPGGRYKMQESRSL